VKKAALLDMLMDRKKAVVLVAAKGIQMAVLKVCVMAVRLAVRKAV
jgi:hypothetical protein